MLDETLKNDVYTLFKELKEDAQAIVEKNSNMQIANEQIASMVGRKVAEACEGYISDMYYYLTQEVKNDDFFQDPEHLNEFYHLNLREKINEKYHFEVNTDELSNTKIDSHKAKDVYKSVSVAAGTVALGGILKYALGGIVTIPVWAIIAASLLTGVGTYEFTGQDNNEEYLVILDRFLDKMQNEVLDWLTDIECYFKQQVRSLYTVEA